MLLVSPRPHPQLQQQQQLLVTATLICCIMTPLRLARSRINLSILQMILLFVQQQKYTQVAQIAEQLIMRLMGIIRMWVIMLDIGMDNRSILV